MSLALLLAAVPGPLGAHNAATAHAVPLTGITVDGGLDDWPEHMAVYPIAWEHPTAYREASIDGARDLSASFRVGWDEEHVYLAVVAVDEELLIYPGSEEIGSQDQVEVYLDADHSGGSVDGGDSRQYRAFARSPGAMDPEAAGADVALRRAGAVTVYEWAVPASGAPLQPGTILGFDVVVCDADDYDRCDWVAWTTALWTGLCGERPRSC